VNQSSWRKAFLGNGRADKDMAMAQCKIAALAGSQQGRGGSLRRGVVAERAFARRRHDPAGRSVRSEGGRMTTAFDDWKAKAQEADILGEAVARGAKLKRAGREHVGPCPACGGTDRFSINIQKRIFNCRGAQGGDVIGMVMHIDGVSFTQACEALTGEPPPNGRSEPLTVEQKHARAKALADAKAREQADKNSKTHTRTTPRPPRCGSGIHRGRSLAPSQKNTSTARHPHR
jgi:hypothetical protein